MPVKRLYQGVPLTRRETYGGLAMPDRITLYQRFTPGRDDVFWRELLRVLLQEEAFELGARLYAETPKAFVRRMAAYWSAWRPD